MTVSVKQIPSDRMDSNRYLLEEEGHVIIIDGCRGAELIRLIRSREWTVDQLLLTHEHFDHIWYLEELRKVFGMPVVACELCSQRIQDVIVDSATVYTQGIMRKLREHDYNPEIMRLYVVGGGGCLIKNFGEYDPDRVTFNEDIHATAIGYEAWARHDLATAKIKAGGQA